MLEWDEAKGCHYIHLEGTKEGTRIAYYLREIRRQKDTGRFDVVPPPQGKMPAAAIRERERQMRLLEQVSGVS